MTKNSLQHSWKRVIVHADMDAFFAAVEQLDQPELRNRPIAIGGDGPRSVVATASYSARRFGISSAMPMVTAKRRCPHLIVVAPRMDRYREVSRAIMGVLESFSQPIEPISLDEAFLDVTQTSQAFPDPMSLGHTIKQAVFEVTGGLTVSVGIGTSKFVAKLASDEQKPDGLTVVPPHLTRSFLAPMSVGRLWGVGPKTTRKLEELGFMTLADITQASKEQLAPMGRNGLRLRELAFGNDERPVQARGKPKSLGWERTLDLDVTQESDIKTLLEKGAVRVAERLQTKKMVAHGVRIKLKTTSFEVITRQISLSAPTSNSMVLAANALRLLKDLSPTGAYRLVGLSAYDLIDEDGGIQMTLPLDQADKSMERAEWIR